MRRFVPLVAALLVTACGSGEERRSSQDLKTYSVEEEPAAADASASMESGSGRAAQPPMVGPSAAPGVAFNYRYAFRLPGERISAVQEQHAQACEKLGLDRCRITGMRYRMLGEEDVEAMLAFKLDPAIARQFGKNGIEAVTRAEGMLVDSEITGEDAGADIAATRRSEAQLAEDLGRIEQQLARARGGSERAELQAQADRIRESIRANRATRAERQESLAKTPVVFNYGSGEVVPGFDTRSSLGAALDRAGENFIAGIAAMLVILLTLLPWALLAALLFWLFHRLKTSWERRRDLAAAAPEPAPV
jgi:hypothetical protein